MSVAQPCAYLLVRLAPHPVRNEFVNVGVVLFDAAGNLVGVRVTPDWRRVRALHPGFDENDMRGLAAELTARLSGPDRTAFLDQAAETFSLGLQLSPLATVFTADPPAELDRLYQELAAPLAASHLPGPRQAIKRSLDRVFAAERVAHLLRPATATELGADGDPYRFDFYYRNGGRHCLQPLPLGGDPGAARELCFTFDRLRRRATDLRATAIAASPPGDDPASRFQAALLADSGIRLRWLDQAAAVAAEIRADLGQA